MDLQEKIYRIVKDILNEEMGINKEVVNKALEIWDIIEKNVCNTEIPWNKKKSTKFDHSVRITNFDTDFTNGVKIKCQLYVYDFENEQEWFEYRVKHPNHNLMMGASTGAYNSDAIKININVICINGKIYNTLIDQIQHEIEHCFQMIKKGGELVRNNYVKNKQRLHNESGFVKTLSFIRYLSFNFEKDAFVNGLFGVLVNNVTPPQEIDDVIKKTNIYSNILALRRKIHIMKEYLGNQEKERESKETTGYNIQQIINLGENVINKYLKKIGKVKTFYIKEYQNNYSFLQECRKNMRK